MQGVLLGLAALACPVGMGVMMWMMGRGMSKGSDKNQPAVPASLEALREEHRRLGAEIERMDGQEDESLSHTRS